MESATSLPFWAVALVLAAFAPFAAKVLASMFERAARTRSQKLLGRFASHPHATQQHD